MQPVSRWEVRGSRGRRGRLQLFVVGAVAVTVETGTGMARRTLGRALRRRRRGVVGIESESGKCFGVRYLGTGGRVKQGVVRRGSRWVHGWDGQESTSGMNRYPRAVLPLRPRWMRTARGHRGWTDLRGEDRPWPIAAFRIWSG